MTALDLVVLERMPHGIFLRVGTAPAPEWFAHAMAAAGTEGPTTIAKAFPFVDHFLDEAEFFWRQGRTGRFRSEPFTMNDAAGVEFGLIASAVVVGHRHLLVLESIVNLEERRQALQAARETVLEHEAHVRRTRGLLSRIETARTLSEKLANSGLGPGKDQLAAEIREQLSTLAQAIDELAPLPKGVTSRQRH